MVIVLVLPLLPELPLPFPPEFTLPPEPDPLGHAP